MIQTKCSSVFALSLLGLLLVQAGCHRSFYRIQANEEAMAILREKTTDPRWALSSYSVEPDATSRMYSPFSQDHPPMPPDDPTSAQLMEVVDGKPGYPHWHAQGDTPYVQNPEWQLFLPIQENGVVKLRMEDAYRLALLHSREYQTENENLFLSALNVSEQRFGFESRLFLPSATGFTSSGNTTRLTNNESLSLRKVGIAGSSLLVSFANDLVWTFPGSVSPTVGTIFSWSFSQPFLRGAGRDVVLEDLTQSERRFLAAIRSLERYRREFFLAITTEGNSYLNLLQRQQAIRIREANVATQRSVVAQFKALVEAGRINNQQLQFTQSSLYRAQEGLLRLKNQYQFSVDSYKVDLGLPPDLQVVIDDNMLDQFQLVDVEMTERQNRITQLQEATGNTILTLLDLRQDRSEELGIQIGAVEYNASGFRVEAPPAAAMPWSKELVEGLQAVLVHLDVADEIHSEIMENSLPQARRDIQRLEAKIGERLESLSGLRGNLEATSSSEGEYAIEPEVLSDEQLEQTPEELKNYVVLVEQRLQRFQETLDQARSEVLFLINSGEELTPVARATYLQGDVTNKIPTYLRELSGLFLELTLIQVEARTDSIVLDPVDVLASQAFEVAKLYRRDWMNARADLVDAWRNVQVVANRLQSDLSVEAGGTGESVRTSISFDAPITRLRERNEYRQALIQYSRARRSYYAFEDRINLQLRNTIRTIAQIKYNFEISRRGVKLAVMRVDQTDSELSRPPSPNASSRSLGSTAARDLLDALDDLRDTQLNFLDLWVQYEVLRRQLDLDMGTMELDEEGTWIDPGQFTPEFIEQLINEARQWPQPENAYDLGFLQNSADGELLDGGMEEDLKPVIDDLRPVPESQDLDLEKDEEAQRKADGTPEPQSFRRPHHRKSQEIGSFRDTSSRKVHQASYVSEANAKDAEAPDSFPTPPDFVPGHIDVERNAYFAGRLLEDWQELQGENGGTARLDPEWSSRRLPH
ncbi:MAG: TolC family protein [Planctomycetota bacterium]|nr:TolC family protein [Planctomycetota bacterium]